MKWHITNPHHNAPYRPEADRQRALAYRLAIASAKYNKGAYEEAPLVNDQNAFIILRCRKRYRDLRGVRSTHRS